MIARFAVYQTLGNGVVRSLNLAIAFLINRSIEGGIGLSDVQAIFAFDDAVFTEDDVGVAEDSSRLGLALARPSPAGLGPGLQPEG